MEGGECQKDKLYLLVNAAQTNPWRNTAGKWDTELTLSHLCLSRAMMLTHRKGDNETETKKSSKEKTSLLSFWVTGSRESSQGTRGCVGHRTGLPQWHRGACGAPGRPHWHSNFAPLTPDQALPALHISQGLAVTNNSDSSVASGTKVYLRLTVHIHPYSKRSIFMCALHKWHTLEIFVRQHKCPRH